MVDILNRQLDVGDIIMMTYTGIVGKVTKINSSSIILAVSRDGGSIITPYYKTVNSYSEFIILDGVQVIADKCREDAEKFTFTKNTGIYVPAGLGHLPTRATRVDNPAQPIVMLVIHTASNWNIEEALDDKGEPIYPPGWIVEKR